MQAEKAYHKVKTSYIFCKFCSIFYHNNIPKGFHESLKKITMKGNFKHFQNTQLYFFAPLIFMEENHICNFDNQISCRQYLYIFYTQNARGLRFLLAMPHNMNLFLFIMCCPLLWVATWLFMSLLWDRSSYLDKQRYGQRYSDR